jgi:tripartite-type tricarboxylate transporter receptor subunit TctC
MLDRTRHRIVVLVVGACLVGATEHNALAQSARTTKIVVPFPAGGAADIAARLLADQLGQASGSTFQVENRPGAGSVVGTEAVARAAPDGSTLLVTANSFVINPILRKVAYDPLTSFDPICHLADTPQILAVNGASPYRSVADLINAARSKPGELTLASVGPATAQHIAFEIFRRAASVSMTHVPYPGGAPAVNALLGQHVTAVLANYSEVAQQATAGQLRPLAVTSRKRLEQLPAVPTLEETGLKDYEASTWLGLVAPAKSSQQVLARLAGWLVGAMQNPDVKLKLASFGLSPVGACGNDFSAYLRKQYEEYSVVIREAGIRAE